MRCPLTFIPIVRLAGVLAISPLLAALAGGLPGQAVEPPAFSVPPLVRQMEIRSIARWGDEIVVETDRRGIDYPHEIASRPWFWRLDPDARTLTRLDPGRGRRFLGFSTGSGERYAVARDGGKVDLLAFNAASPTGRTLCRIGESPRPTGVWVATLGRFICIIGRDQVTVVAGDRVVQKIRLSSVVGPDADRLQLSLGTVRAVAATTREVLLGFDGGEFGGGAYAFSLSDRGRLQQPRKVWSEHVSAIVAQSDDVVWMAGGVGQLGGIAGSLVREQAGQLEVIVHQISMLGREQPVDSHPRLRLARASTIDGLALDSNNGVIAAATQVGLIGYRAGGEIVMLWDKPLSPARVDEDRIDEGQPVGMALQGDRLFLATRFLGVLEFARAPGGFELRGQITIPRG